MKKGKRITLVVTNTGDGSKQMTADESWYFRRPERDLADCGFMVLGREYGARLMNLYLPREFTELVPASYHWTGSSIKIKEEIKDWDYVNSLGCTPYITRWPRSANTLAGMYIYKAIDEEMAKHRETLHHGWVKLVCVWLNESIPDIAYQIPWWEDYLQEEMKDFHRMYLNIQLAGIKATIENPPDLKNFLAWLKTASCVIELLSDVCPAILAVLKLDRRQSYPCLHAGYQWMSHHKLGSWEKVKNLSCVKTQPY